MDWKIQSARAQRMELLYRRSGRGCSTYTGLILEAPSRTVPQPCSVSPAAWGPDADGGEGAARTQQCAV